jgi:hypothetical protein
MLYKRTSFHTLLLTLAFVIFSSSPSLAVFGLSKCEKMVKQVSAQDQLIGALWKNFDKERKKKEKVTISKGDSLLDKPAQYLLLSPDATKLIGMIIDINTAGLKSIRLMKGQPQCFSTSNQSKIINQETQLKSYISEWERALRTKNLSNISFDSIFPSAPSSFLKLFPSK